jgi:hypothetical protein
MAITPLAFRPEIEPNSIVVAQPVASNHWTNIATILNYVNAHGRVVVPQTFINQQVLEFDNFTYRFNPGSRGAFTNALVWLITLRAEPTIRFSTGAAITINGESYTEASAGIFPSLTSKTFFLVQNYEDANYGAESEFVVDIGGVDDNSNFYIQTIACWEINAAGFINTTGFPNFWGKDPSAYNPGNPISNEVKHLINQTAYWNKRINDGTYFNNNLRAVRTNILDHSTDMATVTPITVTGSALFDYERPVLGPKIYRNDTQAMCIWKVYGSGSIGSVNLQTSNSNVNDSQYIAGPERHWTPPRVVFIDCEDLSTEDGLPSGTWDYAQFYISKHHSASAAAGTSIGSISLYTPTSPDLVIDAEDNGTVTRALGGMIQIRQADDGSSGFLDNAIANTPRVENRGYGLDGILIETTRFTNNFTQSEFVSGWTTVNAALSIPGTVDDPMAGSSGAQIVFAASAAAFVYQSISATNGDLWRISCWVKSATTQQVRLFLRQKDAATIVSSNNFTIGPTWQRIQFVGNVGTGASAVRMGIQNASDAAGRTVFVWGAQATVESSNLGARGNSYLRTSGSSVTLPQEEYVIPTAYVPNGWLNDGFIVTHTPFRSSAEMLAAASGSNGKNIVYGFDKDNYVSLTADGGEMTAEVVINSVQENVLFDVQWQADVPMSIEFIPKLNKLTLHTSHGAYGSGVSTDLSWPSSTPLYLGGHGTIPMSGSGGLYGKYIIGL